MDVDEKNHQQNYAHIKILEIRENNTYTRRYPPEGCGRVDKEQTNVLVTFDKSHILWKKRKKTVDF